MSSKTGVGTAPLITGIVLATHSVRAILQNGPSLWSVPAFVGSCSAIVVGAGILFDLPPFEHDFAVENSSRIVLALAVVSFVVGGAVALV